MHPRTVVALFLCALASLAPGCGGGSVTPDTTTTTTAQAHNGVDGTWLIQLSFDQASEVGSGPAGTNTQISLPWTQDTPGANSNLTAGATIAGTDLACSNGVTKWAVLGKISTRPDFTLVSGSVQAPQIAFVLNEFANPLSPLPPGTVLPQGHLSFAGTINTDGTLSGTVTDECILISGQPQQGTWTATRTN